MALIDNLEWRYATKRMTGEKISEEKLHYILDATRLSASSYGLQPYNVVVVSNPEIKKELQAAAYGQPQLVEGSHVLVFCVWDKITSKEVTTFIDNVASKRGMPSNVLDGYKGMIQGTVDSKTQEEQQNWSAKQAYIAAGTALAAAAEQHVDACPMEGFDAGKFDEILGLKEKGLKSVMIIALGVRSSEDQMASLLKVRTDKDKLFHFVD